MAKYLWQVFFYRRLAALGGWVSGGGNCVLSLS